LYANAVQRSELPVVDEFANDKDPAFYGRYRLWFDQVSPVVDSHRAVARVSPDWVVEVTEIFESLQNQHLPLQLLAPETDRRGWDLSTSYAGDWVLSFELLSDVCFIDMRNFCHAVTRLGAGLCDVHFFVMSTGDAPDAWVDEYRIIDGHVRAERWLWAPYLITSRLDFYRALAANRTDDAAFQHFVATLR
jgi:hypothetical protein